MTIMSEGCPETDKAWLAGLWDGEGSVGDTATKGRTELIPQIQLSMTHAATIARAVDVIASLGGTVVAYQVNGRRRDKDWYRDSFAVRVTRYGTILAIAQACIPYATTKLEQWETIRDLCQSRIDRLGLDEQGRLRRGGPPGWHLYSDFERACAQRLRSAAHQSRAVDPARAADGESMEPEPGRAAGVAPAPAVHPGERVDAADSGA